MGKKIILLFWASLCTLMATTSPVHAQYSLRMPSSHNITYDPTADGGFVALGTNNLSRMFHVKFDSNGVEQYGYSYPGICYVATEMHGKIFRIFNPAPYEFTIGKFNMASGALEAIKRVTGPALPFGYFDLGALQLLATPDSGVVVVFTARQARDVANAEMMHMKLDKNLAAVYTAATFIPNFFVNLAPDIPLATIAPDGSVIRANPFSILGLGFVNVVIRYSGTTGQILGQYHYKDPLSGPAPVSLACNANQIVVAGINNDDLFAVSFPMSLSSLQWGYQYNNPGTDNGGARINFGPDGQLYGWQDSTMVRMLSSGLMSWAWRSDSVHMRDYHVPMGAMHMAAPQYTTFGKQRLSRYSLSTPDICPGVAVTVTPTVRAFTSVTVNPFVSSNNGFLGTATSPLSYAPSAFTLNPSVRCNFSCAIVANFSTSTNTFTANFASLTGGATSYNWSFGDGTFSTATNPSHTYAAQGTYNVCLIVTSTCGADTTCSPVTITCSAPNAAFNSASTLLAATFTNTSTANGGVLSYAWTFGDGGTSILPSPSHTYAAPGTYNVCLIATTSCGIDTTCSPVTISCPVPVANYFTNSTFYNASFVNTSTGSQLSYNWTFGDGGNSNLQHPSHTYAQAGTYNVCMIATSVCGADTICQAVTITCPPPGGSFTASSMQLVGIFASMFTGPVITYFWTFGDGGTSNSPSPNHSYAQGGTYTVCLIATGPCGVDTICQSVDICLLPNTAFTTSTSGLSATFNNTTSSATQPLSYVWDFGDGGTSTATSPVHTYTANGTYWVCLTATSVCGTETHCDSVTVTCQLPSSAWISNGSFPTVFFQDLSSGNPNTWQWDFGDGATSSLQNPSHTYVATGLYQVCLVAGNACGDDGHCAPLDLSVDVAKQMSDGFSLSPVPAQTRLQVRAAHWMAGDLPLRVFAADGKLVYQGTFAGEVMELDLKAMADGIYFLELGENEGQWHGKFLVRR